MNDADPLSKNAPSYVGIDRSRRRNVAQSLFLVVLMIGSTFAAIDFVSVDVSAASDQDGDGIPIAMGLSTRSLHFWRG